MRFLGPAELDAFADARALDDLLRSRELVVAYGAGEVRGFAAAALLFSDYAVLHATATLHVDVAEAWAAVAWRLGRTALRWALDGENAGEVVDAITESEPRSWLEEWMRHRSVMALDSAALLIRSRGGDRLERAEFARLFAAGEPQKGLGAFLAKIKPSW
jgi:hypothetical protein